MNAELISLATSLRHELHMNAELSNHEKKTKQLLIEFIKTNSELEIHDMGAWFYAAYRAIQPKKRIAFRADFDALPIDEGEQLPYHSLTPNVSHKCGHDGHSACLAAFALQTARNGCSNDVFFLFQNAEETGDGAKSCCELIRKERIDEIYGFHNMPSFPLGSVMVHTGTAACASTGLILHFVGKNSHASQPELGRNPAFAIAKLILDIPSFTKPDEHNGILLCTVICVKIGEEAFGTSAGVGSLMLTLRGEHEYELSQLIQNIKKRAMDYCVKYNLELLCDFRDTFPETRNDIECVRLVRECCKNCGIPITPWNEPFRSSEDFGYYTNLVRGALFYVGDGETHPALHTTEFDFPDEIIGTVCKLYEAIADSSI